MRDRLKIVIPGNPGDGKVNTTKTAIVVKGRVRYVKSKRARVFADVARLACISAAQGQPEIADRCRLAPTLAASVSAYWPTCRRLPGTTDLGRGDVDAPIKACLDAIEHAGIIDDDVRFVEVTARKGHSKENPRIEIEIWPYDGDAT